jgi:hypothetical protein
VVACASAAILGASFEVLNWNKWRAAFIDEIAKARGADPGSMVL